jgi:hypothetical protein
MVLQISLPLPKCTLHSTHRIYFCASYRSHNEQRYFSQTALTGWSCGRERLFPVKNEINFYPSSRTMALRSTQPLTEMCTRNLPGGKGRPARKADNLTAICYPIFYKIWESRLLKTPWDSKACYREIFILPFIIIIT